MKPYVYRCVCRVFAPRHHALLILHAFQALHSLLGSDCNGTGHCAVSHGVTAVSHVQLEVGAKRNYGTS